MNESISQAQAQQEEITHITNTRQGSLRSILEAGYFNWGKEKKIHLLEETGLFLYWFVHIIYIQEIT